MLTKTKEFIRKSKYFTLLFLILHLVGFASSIDAIMGARTSQGAIAWVVSLNTFPLVAVPSYWVLGRSEFKGYITARQANESGLADVSDDAKKNISAVRSSISTRYPAVRAAELLADLPMFSGNSATLLVDGEKTFSSIFSGIDEAEKYILVQFYIVKDDNLGRELKSKLIQKAREGVRVYFLYDEVGSYNLPESYISELTANGVEAVNFHSRKGPKNRFQINFRNHRKIVVVDGQTCWLGGHNVGDEYMGRSEKFDYWRDTHLKINGPATLAAQLSFLEDWHWATDSLIELDWNAALTVRGDENILIIPSGPADKYETAGLMFTHAINSAKERIWIASPYFVPDESIIAALQLAGLRGVDVRIVIPDESDSLLVYLAAYSYFQQAGKSGVKFYRYTNGFMHQKTMLIDDNLSAVGTANFDNRSFRLNFEITAFIVDHDFNSQVEQMFINDFKDSRHMQGDELQSKPYWFKLMVQSARLMAPIL